MINRFRSINIALAFLIVWGVFCVENCLAGERKLKAETSEHVDALLVLDASGSMRLTDPQRLRDEGAKLFSRFLKEGDRLGIIEFSKEAKVLRPLSDFDPEQFEKVSKKIAKVGTSGEYTNLLAGVKEAASILAHDGRRDAEHAIILLSDGKMEPAPKSGPATVLTNELLNQVLPELKSKEVKVHTLAFSDKADRDLLSQIAVATNGINWFTSTADEIHESFADLFLVVKKPQMLPLTSKGFRIDAEISEATFYINREGEEKVTILTPEGDEQSDTKHNPNVKWFRGKKFDVITIDKPEPGQWQVAGLPKNEGFATLLTNLKLVTQWKTTLIAGVPELLQAQLHEAKKPVVLPQMTGVINYAFRITPVDRISEPVHKDFLRDEGKDGDKIGSDGIFSSRIILQDPGEYKLRIVANGPTFERHLQLTFRVKPRPITLAVVLARESMSEKYHGGDGSKDYFQIRLGPEITDVKKARVTLKAVDDESKAFIIPLTRIGEVYEVSTSQLPHDGQYMLTAYVEASGKRHKKIKEESREIEYQKVSTKNGKEEVHVVVVEKPKEPEKPSNAIPIALTFLILLINGGAGWVCFSSVRSEQGGETSFEVEGIGTAEPIHELISDLQEKLKVEEIDFSDPIFTDENLEFKALDSLVNLLVQTPVASTQESDQESSGEPERDQQEGEAGGEEAGSQEKEEAPEAAEDAGDSEEDPVDPEEDLSGGEEGGETADDSEEPPAEEEAQEEGPE